MSLGVPENPIEKMANIVEGPIYKNGVLEAQTTRRSQKTLLKYWHLLKISSRLPKIMLPFWGCAKTNHPKIGAVL